MTTYATLAVSGCLLFLLSILVGRLFAGLAKASRVGPDEFKELLRMQ